MTDLNEIFEAAKKRELEKQEEAQVPHKCFGCWFPLHDCRCLKTELVDSGSEGSSASSTSPN